MLLTASWIYILIFSSKEILKGKFSSKSLFVILFLILIIDSIRTIIESLYFGTRLASQYGVLPKELFTILSNPAYLFIPKFINAIAAISIIILIFKKWYPNKIHEEEKLQKKYEEEKKNKLELQELNNNLDMLVKKKTKELEELNAKLEEKIKIEVNKNKIQEQKLFNQTKMAAMGEMLKNIAHQWRQPLNTVSTLSTGTKMNIEMRLATDKSIIENLDSITDTARHMSQTIDDFQNFFKPDKAYTDFTMKELIDTTLKIAGPALKAKDIQINIENISNCSINGPINEYTQVMMNILTNAKDALKNKNIDEKTITIKTEKVDDMCTIQIEDNAGGIDTDIINRVFEPYFTTKHKSQGTGLGLYMSKEIIEKHLGGFIEVNNTPKGAKFTIKVANAVCNL